MTKPPICHPLVVVYLPSSVLLGREACGTLEVLAEEGLVGEVERGGNLLYRHVRRLEHGACLEYHVALDPLACRAPCVLLHELREVLGSDAQLVGVEAYESLLGSAPRQGL